LRSGVEAQNVRVFKAVDGSLLAFARRVNHDEPEVEVREGYPLPLLRVDPIFRIIEGVFLAQHGLSFYQFALGNVAVTPRTMIKFWRGFEGSLLFEFPVEIAALWIIKTVLIGDRDMNPCRFLYFPWAFSPLFLGVSAPSEGVPLLVLLGLSSSCSLSPFMVVSTFQE
jgi:hypothetical protein